MKNDEEIRTEVCSTMKRPEFLTSKNSLKIQSEDSLVELLQSLADMDITFKALKETDIGRHVNRLWKNPSNDVRRLVKQLVRDGSSGSDKNNFEPEPKAKVVPRKDAPPAKLTHSIPLAASAPPRKRQQKESSLDLERLALTRKRFHENYQEAENRYFTIFWLY
ncbi:unnamed protein product [Camellia sinensis]